jgi:hypothetical protein
LIRLATKQRRHPVRCPRAASPVCHPKTDSQGGPRRCRPRACRRVLRGRLLPAPGSGGGRCRRRRRARPGRSRIRPQWFQVNSQPQHPTT